MSDWIGGSAASDPNDFISSLTDASLCGEEQIHAIIKKIDQTILGIVMGGGILGGAPYEENNLETGFKINPTVYLGELRSVRQMYVNALSDPDQVGSVELLISQVTSFRC